MMIDHDSNRFSLYVQRTLLRKARQHKGTELGGFLKCAHDHLAATQAALDDAAKELKDRSEEAPRNLDGLAKLGWQAVECSICGSHAMAYPKPEEEPIALLKIIETQGTSPISRKTMSCTFSPTGKELGAGVYYLQISPKKWSFKS
jgi:hypothetical protein